LVVLTGPDEHHHDKPEQAEHEPESSAEHLQQPAATETQGDRFERDLNDVARQRLVALALDLGMASTKPVGLAADMRVGEGASKGSAARAVEDYLNEAEQWFRKAASAGHHTAQFNLGLLLAGRGDVAEAEDWLQKAATSESRELALQARQRLDDLREGRG
jgi:TPR repeat protein